jgi:hypothetical protein
VIIRTAVEGEIDQDLYKKSTKREETADQYLHANDGMVQLQLIYIIHEQLQNQINTFLSNFSSNQYSK